MDRSEVFLEGWSQRRPASVVPVPMFNRSAHTDWMRVQPVLDPPERESGVKVTQYQRNIVASVKNARAMVSDIEPSDRKRSTESSKLS